MADEEKTAEENFAKEYRSLIYGLHGNWQNALDAIKQLMLINQRLEAEVERMKEAIANSWEHHNPSADLSSCRVCGAIMILGKYDHAEDCIVRSLESRGEQR